MKKDNDNTWGIVAYIFASITLISTGVIIGKVFQQEEQIEVLEQKTEVLKSQIVNLIDIQIEHLEDHLEYELKK